MIVEDYDGIRHHLTEIRRARKRCLHCGALFDGMHVEGCKHGGKVIESECEEPRSIFG